ncbi:MAG: lipoyl synthase [Rikenellaceae bacterium]
MTSSRKMCGKTSKPEWLKIRLPQSADYARVASLVQRYGLHTICSSGKCPNISHCWSAATATFLIAGDICTRGCRFCATQSGRPLPLDSAEPSKIAHSVKVMELKHAVITSVTRDDLKDGGAAHWVQTIQAVRAESPETTIEVLIPDMQGKEELLDLIIAARPDIIGHNVETVRRLTPEVRSKATYEMSLGVLSYISEKGAEAKSSIMLGLGESEQEVLETLQDLYNVGVRRVTLGQYLQPTLNHTQVSEYVHPDKFEEYRQRALEMGFTHCESGPLVRSSYHAQM